MFPPMPMFSSEGGADPDFLVLLDGRLSAIMCECGLKRTVDTNTRATRNSPLSSMFALNEDAIEDLRAGEWDDRPAIEKILHVMISSSKTKRAVEPFVARVLAHLPGTCTVAVMIAYSFTPVADGEEGDLTKVGRWSVALRDVGGQVSGSNTTRNWQGDVLDRQELQDALDGVRAACARYRDAFKLQPIPQRGEGFGQFIPGALGGDVGPYVEAPIYREDGQGPQPVGREADAFRVAIGNLPVADPRHDHDGPQG